MSFEPTLITQLRLQRAGIGLKIAATGIVALLLAVFTLLFGEHPGIECLFAVLASIFLLAWIWRSRAESTHLGSAIVATCIAWVFALPTVGIINTIVYRYHRITDRHVLLASGLLATAFTIFIWANYVARRRSNQPVMDEENVVLVHCPVCRYRMNGLKEIRCPECGATFTIDELIRAQNYAGSTVPRGSADGKGTHSRAAMIAASSEGVRN